MRDARVPARHAAVEATADEATTDEAAAAALAEELVAMRATRRAAFAARDVRHCIRAYGSRAFTSAIAATLIVVLRC